MLIANVYNINMNKKLRIPSSVSIILALPGIVTGNPVNPLFLIFFVISFIAGVIAIIYFFSMKNKKANTLSLLLAMLGTGISGVVLGILLEVLLFFPVDID